VVCSAEGVKSFVKSVGEKAAVMVATTALIAGVSTRGPACRPVGQLAAMGSRR
jgi:hypothetical protein